MYVLQIALTSIQMLIVFIFNNEQKHAMSARENKTHLNVLGEGKLNYYYACNL